MVCGVASGRPMLEESDGQISGDKAILWRMQQKLQLQRPLRAARWLAIKIAGPPPLLSSAFGVGGEERIPGRSTIGKGAER